MKYLRFQANRKPCSGCSQQIPSPHCWTQSSVPGGCRTHCCLPKGCTHLLQGVLIVLLSLSLSNKWDPVFFPGLHGWECWAFTWVGGFGQAELGSAAMRALWSPAMLVHGIWHHPRPVFWIKSWCTFYLQWKKKIYAFRNIFKNPIYNLSPFCCWSCIISLKWM